MGHLPIVNNETIQDVLNTGYVCTRGNLGAYAIKTVSDLFSDVLAVRKGDLLFPWITLGGDNHNIGFRYVLKVDGKPIYVPGQHYPIKIPIQLEVQSYEIALPEYQALDLFNEEILWNAIGKKSLGRGRSFTHQTPAEDEILLKLMADKNAGEHTITQINRVNYANAVEISINPNQENLPNDFYLGNENEEGFDRIASLNLANISWVRNGGFSYEKTLEAWLMQNFDLENCQQLWDVLNTNYNNVKWIGNYLAFGVAGSNIDAVVIGQRDGKEVLYVFELKNNSLNLDGYRAVCSQVIKYAEFLHKAVKGQYEVIPVIVSFISDHFNRVDMLKHNNQPIEWIGYYIQEGSVFFEQQLI